MAKLFTGLLLSCPNDGGLFYLDGRQAIKLDSLDTTGIDQADGRMLRGLQLGQVYVFDGQACTHEMSELSVPDIHDVLLGDEVHYVVGTQGNEVVKLDRGGSVLQRFTFPGDSDSWHVNCLVRFGSRMLFSAFGDYREHRAYKAEPIGSGFVQDLHTGERLIVGLSQPHSLVQVGTNLLLANSYEGEIHEYDETFQLLRKRDLGGYTRGILVDGNTIYVGLSASRNRESGAENATLLALDVISWDELGRMQLPVNEIYNVLMPKAEDLPTILAVNASLASRVLESRYDERERSLSEALARLQSEVQERQAWIEGQAEQLQAGSTLMDELKQHEEQLRGELQTKSAFADELVRQLDQKQNELKQREEQLQEELLAKGSFADELVRQLEQKQNELKQREEQLQEELLAKGSFADELVRQLEQKQNELKQREEQLQEELLAKGSFADELVRQLDQKQNELKQREKQLQEELLAKGSFADELVRHLEQKQNELKQREEQLQKELLIMERLVTDLNQQLDQKQAELRQLKTQFEDVAVELQTKDMHMDELRDQLDQIRAELQRQEDSSREAIERLRARDVHVDKLDLQISRLRDALADCEAQLNHVRASVSWRMTAPLRACNAFRCRVVAAQRRAISAVRHVFQDVSSRRKYATIARQLGPLGAMRHSLRFLGRGGPSAESEQVHSRPLFDLRNTGSKSVVVLSTMHCRYVAELIVSALERAGIVARIIYEMPMGAYDDVPHFVICPQMFERLPGLYASFQMEQSVSTRWFTPDYLRKLENSFAILDYSLENIARLVSMGLHSKQFYYMPVGYLPKYESNTSHVEKEYDVLFYGDIHNDRRRSAIAELEKVCKVKVISNLFGTAMTHELRRARIVVNIHYYQGALLESTRLWECLSLGCMVVSERSSDMDQHEELLPLVDFVDEGDFAGMAARVRHWLNDEVALHERVSSNATHAASMFNRFDYFFYRFLLASGNLSFEHFWRLIGSAYPLLSDKLCLNLPEYTDRAVSFDKDNHYGFHRFPGLRHSKGWMGAALSYKYMIRLAMKQGIPMVSICEDDVKFPEYFDATWAKISSYLTSSAGQWHVFSGLIADLHEDVNILSVNQHDGCEFVTMDKMISMVFNVYDQASYELVAKWDETNEDVVTNTIDRFLERNKSIRVLTTCPFLVGHKEDLYSTLWGGQNTIYSELISKSEALMHEKVGDWYAKRNRWRKWRSGQVSSRAN